MILKVEVTLVKKVGFTGTRVGMTNYQKKQLITLLAEMKPFVLVHGACIGADDEADVIATALGVNREIWPSTSASMRISNSVLESRIGSKITTIHPPKASLKRNIDIARSDYLIACPQQMYETLRSGTWATVHQAKRFHKSVTVIGPQGMLQW